ncbi:MAG: methyltransferase domain-containing protein [Alphaproteobacteria bacterium]|nr:methyltransferase domain-containing protein [Alphaproteobacteria bacterium]
MTNASTSLEKESVKSAVAGGVANPADKARMHGSLGKLLIRQKRWAHAVGELNQAITLDPKNVNWLLARSEASEKLGNINQALMDASDAVILDAKNPEASDQLGILLVSTRKFDQAALCFAEALNLKPGELKYALHLARTLELMEAHPAALELYQTMIAQEPMKETLYHQAAGMCEKIGDLAQALAIYDQAIENNCISSEIYRRAGLIARKMGDFNLARARFMAGLAHKPNDAVLLHFVGLNDRAAPKSLPDGFIAEHFNQIAANYESDVISRNYRVPGLLRQALLKVRPRIDPDRATPQKLSSIFDLGCGTGIIGIMVSDLTMLLKGVDLSAQMMLIAQSKGIYQEFSHNSAVKALSEETRSYEVITAAGLLSYVGDTTDLFAKIFDRLQPGGVLIFDFDQVTDCDGYKLRDDIAFVYNADYIKLSLEKSGFEIAEFAKEILVRGDDVDHEGYLVTALKPLA